MRTQVNLTWKVFLLCVLLLGNDLAYSSETRVVTGGKWIAALSNVPERTVTGSPKVSKDPAQNASVMRSYGNLPLHFIENQGQVDPKVKYYSRSGGHTTFFTKEGLVVALTRAEQKGELDPGKTPLSTLDSLVNRDREFRLNEGRYGFARRPANRHTGAPSRSITSVVSIKPVGIQEETQIVALELQGHRVNYFIGNDPAKWRTDIPTFKAVSYQEAYPGIDLKFYGRGRELEYDVVVKPGADPAQVQFAYEGVKELEVTEEGNLALHLQDGGMLVQKKPLIYQTIAGRRIPREGRFALTQNGAGLLFGFAVASYDPEFPLIIDPVLTYSTYLGGSETERGYAIAVDSSGCAYVAGQTNSIDFPTHYPIQGLSQGLADVFVTKLNAGGNALVYSTYLGGSDNDEGYGIAVDAGGCAHVTGWTYSDKFPTYNAYQDEPQGGRDCFVTKLNAGGNGFAYSTYLGGSLVDGGWGIAVDTSGRAYIAGGSYSNNFPVTKPSCYQEERQGSKDATLTIFNASGGMVYSTYLGGGAWDDAGGVAVDTSGGIYITGTTGSDDFPTLNPYQGYQNAEDAFVTKFNALGAGLAYSTYLGGGGNDAGNGIAVDTGGCAYVVGVTESDDFPTANPYQGYQGEDDAFVSKLAAGGSSLVYSTYLGGSLDDCAKGIAVNVSGCAHVVGDTRSDDFPTVNPYQGYQGGTDCSDAFVTIFTAGGQPPNFSTYLGSGKDDYGMGIALDASSCYVTGVTYATYSAKFPTYNAYQDEPQGGGDVFVTKIGEPEALPNLTYWQAPNGSFTIKPNKNLQWGSEITVFYGFQNNGQVDIPEGTRIRWRFYLSSDPIITTDDIYGIGYYLDSGLRKGYGRSGDFTLSLPATPPEGFSLKGTFYIGMILDPLGELPESNENDNSNQGLGKDTASIEIGVHSKVPSWLLLLLLSGDH